MSHGPSLLRRAARRGRRLLREAQAEAPKLQSERRTALRIPDDRQPPFPSAFARFGERSFVVPPVRVAGVEGIEVGDDVIVHEAGGFSVDVASGARLVLGDRVKLGPGVEIVCQVGVTLEAGVSTSDYASISDSWALLSHPPGNAPPPGAPVVIGAGAYLGWGSFVGPGVHVGEGAYVGEGAIVLEDVPPHTVVFGNPAQVVRFYDAEHGSWAP
jgi:carbonic anhydrase/acetyltransferase-like protein (isoleucine patch superfamily)